MIGAPPRPLGDPAHSGVLGITPAGPVALVALEDDHLREARGEPRGHREAHDAGADDRQGRVGHVTLRDFRQTGPEGSAGVGAHFWESLAPGIVFGLRRLVARLGRYSPR